MSKQYADSIANRCKHKGSSQDPCCKAGVRYDDVKDTSVRPYLFPCSKKQGISHRCEFAEFPTPEEVEASERRFEDRIKNIGVARGAIVEFTKGKRGVAGNLKCPCCESGALHFSVSGYNGHIHAQCTTKECVSWME